MKKLAQRDQVYILGIFDRKTGEHLGFIDIVVITRLHFQVGNLGYEIHNQYWGKGFAKEAARAAALLAFKQLKLHRLEAGTERENKGSVAVARSIGMTHEGVRRGFIFEQGKWRDLDFYALTAEQYGVRKPRPSVRILHS